jgi:hypothetical protein
MPKLELRFDLAAILLASALTAFGVSTANAGGARGGIMDRSEGHAASAAANYGPQRDGGRCCVGGGDVRSLSGGAAGAQK